ncbi:MAG: hypothetical protein LBQ54_13100 [Planctomycetaceae bacterium]|jgi:hypothetical protein|nr:hypothetical protein [Planctomycetaceae bacterium]
MKSQILLFSLINLLYITGCGVPNSPVSGRVTFEDGTPLTVGEVIFALSDSEEYFAKGKIGSDGTYSLAEQVIGKESGKPGCKPGEYKVFIGSTSTTEIINNKTLMTHAIDQDYANKNKTPLTATVPGGTYDFKIPPYKK